MHPLHAPSPTAAFPVVDPQPSIERSVLPDEYRRFRVARALPAVNSVALYLPDSNPPTPLKSSLPLDLHLDRTRTTGLHHLRYEPLARSVPPESQFSLFRSGALATRQAHHRWPRSLDQAPPDILPVALENDCSVSGADK